MAAECMAIVWAVKKCAYYLRGINDFTVVTDHRPLLGIFTKPLHELSNARLLRFHEKLLDYVFSVRWCPGKDHLVADAISRAPVFPGSDEPDPACSLLRATIASEPMFEDFLACANSDPNYRKLIQCLTDDTKFPQELQLYQCVRNDLSIYREDDHCLVIYNASRVVVPRPLRRCVLDSLHVSHCGEVKTYEDGRQLYYWPAMKNDICAKG